MLEFLAVLLVALAWVGHAYILTALLNYVYARPWPKVVLKPWRLVTGVLILAFPWVVWNIFNPAAMSSTPLAPGEDPLNGTLGRALLAYAGVCLFFGAIVFPVITFKRYLRKSPACVASETTRTLDLWPELGDKLVGDGKGRPLTRLPGNCVFKIDLTDLTLALPNLPSEWDGLTLLLLSDLHFHGTPSRAYFDRVLDELTVGPEPDLVCLAGDFVDSDAHREWIPALLGRLRAKEAKLAILGNHDKYHDPDRVRAELAAAGCTVLGNAWREITVRGAPCVVVGHEGPWFNPAPDLTGAPTGPFRLCLSHTPDNFYWGQSNGVRLMLCGHVHGGAIRIPLIGSIFVPSVYGRRFDCGVFEENGTAMVVSRGISGKEPLRFRCNPQAIRITLKPR
ncbi:MAG: metallophosphoesterase [Planctomycetes bacterium]|nr:metallophosphoesterase [Planctomycetota bacterium]